MSCSKRWKLKSIFPAKSGCGGCGPKATDVVEPKQKPKSKTSSDLIPSYCSSYSGGQPIIDGDTSTSSSLYHEYIKCSKTVSRCPKIRNSFAMVKDSDNPYEDFRQSMLQMIFEKEIYSRNDLQQLLQCFLQLNSTHHHEIIVRAFMEIWNGGVSAAEEEEEVEN